MSCQY